jgi:transcriptional regulator with XRE-family HTH domain
MDNNLATWLNIETETRGWSLRELARRVGVSHTTIINIANQQRRPSADLCRRIALALHVPPEEVFRKAGLLPQLPKQDKATRELNDILPLLTDEELELLLHAARGMLKESAGDRPKAEDTEPEG